MFDFLKKSHNNSIVAPVSGTCITLDEVPDKVFSSRIIGDGFAVVPDSDVVVAPADGEIMIIPSSKHAFGMKTKNGAELLVHIGLDTVNLEGQGFSVLEKVGSKVKAGTPVVRFDRGFMEEKGINLTTMLIFTAGYDKEVKLSNYGQHVTAGETVLSQA